MSINKNRSIIRHIVEGYEEIEPCILSALALKRNIFLVGAHGVGKSTLGKLLGKAADESGNGFRFFSADKANLINIAGFPDIESGKKTGKFDFTRTDRTIFGAKIVMADELPRADKERQNYWLEVAEEGTFFGIPTGIDMLIATGNDATYQGNFRLDLALKSRFLYWLPCPTFKIIESGEVAEMIKLNFEGKRDIKAIAKEMRELIHEMRIKIKEFSQDEALKEQIIMFIATFTQFIKDKIACNKELTDNAEAYISPREFANQMIHSMLGLGAYFTIQGYPNPFQQAGYYTTKYVIETRHASAGVELTNICQMAWRQLQGMLVADINTPGGKLQYLFASAISPAQKIGFWRDRFAEAVKILNDVDLTNMAGDTLTDIRQNDIKHVAPFYSIMSSNSRTKHISNEVEGFVITEVVRRLFNGKADTSGASPDAKMYSKYGIATELTPENVSEIIGNN